MNPAFAEVTHGAGFAIQPGRVESRLPGKLALRVLNDLIRIPADGFFVIEHGHEPADEETNDPTAESKPAKTAK